MAKANMKMKTKTSLSEKSFPFSEIGLLFIGLSLLFSFFPLITRAWGLNYIAFFDGWIILLFYVLLVCFWLPQTNRYLVEKISAISRKSTCAFLKKHRYVFFILVSIMAGGCFYLLKIKYIFLGDTDIRAKQIEDGVLFKAEYFTMLSLKYLLTILQKGFGYTGVQIIRLTDYISGSLFIFFSLCNANLLGNTFLKKAAAFVISTLSLTILLQFCGYTEIYALPALFLQAYLFTCLLYLNDKTWFFVPALTLLISIAFHWMLVCMLPSLLFLLYRKVLGKYSFFRSRRNILILILVSLPFIYYAVNKYALPMMFPLQSEGRLLTMFSMAHFTEFFNSQLLGAGIGFLIWITILIYSPVHKMKYNAIHWFFLIASVSIIGLMFVFRMDRGSGDWDICSFAAIVCNPANACFLLTWNDEKICKNIKYGMLMIAGFSVLHTSMWILTNKTDASIRWVETAFATDPGNYYQTSFNNEAMLAALFSSNGLDDRAIKWGKKAWLKYPDDHRMGYNYANTLIGLNRKEEACPVLEQTVKTFPAYALPYASLITLYLESRNYNALYRVLMQMEQVYKQAPEAFTSRLSQAQLDSYFKILEDFKKQIQEQ
ncbi:MAG: hypothetical protein LBT83_00795 [Tannerella sp.]|jgi:hypothetical protein|nr:hypothetical protein [Tannerella sp.]